MLPTIASPVRLLLILLLSCAVCLNALKSNTTVFLTQNGNLPLNGAIAVISNPINVTNHPGPLYVTVSAQYSIDFCISPYAAVAYDLRKNCPPNNYHQFTFTNNISSTLPIALFLDDFSMNFRGQYLDNDESVISPPHIYEFNLLQNIEYYISLAFDQTDLPINSTYTGYEFQLSIDETVCTANTQVPNKEGCANVLQLGPSNHTSIYNLIKGSPALISFIIPPLTPSLYLTVTGLGNSTDQYPIDDLNLEIAYNQYPTKSNAQYNFSTYDPTLIFVGNYPTSMNFTLNNPLPGTYYASISSLIDLPRNISVSISNDIEPCTIPTSDIQSTCGEFNYTVLGEDVSNLEFNSSSDWYYFAVPEVKNFQFGVKIQNFSNSDDVLAIEQSFQVLIGNNYFPSTATLQTGIGNTYVPFNGTFYIAQNSTNETNYIIAVNGPPFLQVIVWQGALCPENCSGHGSCSTNFACQCDNDYSGDYCENHSKKLSTLYIILIIIGGAIVLAVLIGVPVALYLNNRKRARYERV